MRPERRIKTLEENAPSISILGCGCIAGTCIVCSYGSSVLVSANPCLGSFLAHVSQVMEHWRSSARSCHIDFVSADFALIATRLGKIAGHLHLHDWRAFHSENKFPCAAAVLPQASAI